MAPDRLDFEHLIEPVGGVVDELLAALDGLAAEDLAPLFGPALLARLRPLLVAQNRLAAEIARTVREAEVSGAAEVDGLKTMGSWLCGHGHLSAREAARVVRAGRALAHLPAMAAAFAGIALTGALALFSTWALVGVGVALAGVGILAVAGRMPQRTAAGERVRERTAAFRDWLASAEPTGLTERTRVPDLAETARADVTVRYLPYAVALGVAETWTGVLDRSAARAPDWYQPLPGRDIGVWPALLTFSASDNPALTPPASSGGGSTVVGGGAGGGGGGSW